MVGDGNARPCVAQTRLCVLLWVLCALVHTQIRYSLSRPKGRGLVTGVLQELFVGRREGLPRVNQRSVPGGHLGLSRQVWAVSLLAWWMLRAGCMHVCCVA